MPDPCIVYKKETEELKRKLNIFISFIRERGLAEDFIEWYKEEKLREVEEEAKSLLEA